jgi:arylsulfatase A-like enzyme
MHWRRVAAAALVVWIGTSCSFESVDEPRRPNVLLYVVDTLRADALPMYGNQTVRAPNLQRLAREGQTFDRAYAPSAWTRSSMASILTGAPPRTHGAITRRDALMGDVPLVSERLWVEGYATAAFIGNPNAGREFGFDRGWGLFYEGFVAGPLPSVDELNEQALAWLETAPRPFLLLMLPVDPHDPYLPPKHFDRHTPGPGLKHWEEKRAKYFGEVGYADHGFGVLIEALRDRGELDDTIVVFTSDHGEEFGEHGQLGHGKTVFEEVVHVPLLLRHPGSFMGATRAAGPVEHVDLLPTLLELTGVGGHEGLPGRSLLGEPRAAEHPIVAHIEIDRVSASALIEGEWKLIFDEKTNEAFLYHLADDPRERRDLSAMPEHRSRALAMRARLSALERDQGKSAADRAPVEHDDLSPATRRSLEALGYLAPSEDVPH